MSDENRLSPLPVRFETIYVHRNVIYLYISIANEITAILYLANVSAMIKRDKTLTFSVS